MFHYKIKITLIIIQNNFLKYSITTNSIKLTMDKKEFNKTVSNLLPVLLDPTEIDTMKVIFKIVFL